MIVGRINTVKAFWFRPLARVEYLLVQCPICRIEYTVPPGDRHSMASRIAMCPDCRNDTGRRESLTHARYLGPSPFNVRPRLVSEGSDVYRATAPKEG